MPQYLVVAYVCQDADSPAQAAEMAREAIAAEYWPLYVQPLTSVSMAAVNTAIIDTQEFTGEEYEPCPCESGHPERCPDVGSENAEKSDADVVDEIGGF